MSVIQTKEAAVDEDPTADDVQALIQLYQEYRSATYPDDESVNARYCYREAGLHYRMNQYEQAAELLQTALRNYPGAAVSPAGCLYARGPLRREVAPTGTGYNRFPGDAGSFSERLPFGKSPTAAPRMILSLPKTAWLRCGNLYSQTPHNGLITEEPMLT